MKLDKNIHISSPKLTIDGTQMRFDIPVSHCIPPYRSKAPLRLASHAPFVVVAQQFIILLLPKPSAFDIRPPSPRQIGAPLEALKQFLSFIYRIDAGIGRYYRRFYVLDDASRLRCLTTFEFIRDLIERVYRLIQIDTPPPHPLIATPQSGLVNGARPRR